MASVAFRKPFDASWRRTISRIEYCSPMGTSGFGMTVVYGRRRTPLPPASITTCRLSVAHGLSMKLGSVMVMPFFSVVQSDVVLVGLVTACLLYTSPSPRDG